VTVPNDGEPLFDTADRASGAMGGPVFSLYNQSWFDRIGRAARDRGVDLLLTGQLGNFTISYDGLTLLPSLLRTGRWRRLAREVYSLHRNRGMTWPGLIDHTLRGILPTRVRKRILAIRGHAAPAITDVSLIGMGFAGRLGIAEEAVEAANDIRNRLPRGVDVRIAVLQGFDPARIGRGFRRQFGITIADPTADRRVVEFCLAIPQDQFLRSGETRSLVRRAFRGIVPDQVIDEKRRGWQAADWHVAAASARPEMEAELQRLERSPMARECLDLGRVRQLLDDWPSGGWHTMPVRNAYQFALTRALATGRFIRRVEGSNE